MLLEEIQMKVKKPDTQAMENCRSRWNSIAKPLHSLGKMEDYLVKIAGMTGSSKVDLKKRALIIMCADNGVVEEGVTQTGQEVTAIVSENFLTGQASSSVMCEITGTDIIPIDVGIAVDTNIRNCKIAYGTRNMTKGPAMTREEAMKAVETGIHIVGELKEKGYRIFATGEMGIGNTTTSSAVAAVLLNKPAEVVTGKGAGLTSEGLTRKIHAIKQSIELNQPNPEDALDIVAKVGGFDIAALAGVFLGGAIYRVPIVIDGFISSVAALIAVRLCPLSREYMLASHVSREPAAHFILEALELESVITCDMCLGEGTGALTLFPILDMACEVYNRMSTFCDIQIEAYKPLS